MSNPLKRPLTFGDAEQIEALKQRRIKTEALEEILGREIDGPLKRYRVELSYVKEETVFFDAPDKASAKIIFHNGDYIDDWPMEDCEVKITEVPSAG